MFAIDYFCIIGAYDEHALVDAMPDITDYECRQMLGLNAAQLLAGVPAQR